MIRTKVESPQFIVRILHHGGMGGPPPPPLEIAELHKDVLDITTNKRLGQPAGSFLITLRPRLKWHDIIHPMDYIEILMWRPPRLPRVVMRGFVDAVSEMFNIESGKPQHQIVVAGRDYGKLLLDMKVLVLDWLKGGPAATAGISSILFRVLRGMDRITSDQKYRNGSAFDTDLPAPPPGTGKWLNPSQVMELAWDEFFFPQFQTLNAVFGGQLPIPNLDLSVKEPGNLKSFEPPFVSIMQQPYAEVFSVFRSFMHGPWRELYWREGSLSPAFRYRETPWLDFEGYVIQSGAFDTLEVFDLPADIRVGRQLSRSGEEIANYFFTYSSVMAPMARASRLLGSDIEGQFRSPFKGNPYVTGFPDNTLPNFGMEPLFPVPSSLPDSSSDFNRHGFKIMEWTTPYIDLPSNAEFQEKREWNRLGQVLGHDLNKIIVRAFNHGGLLESGTMPIMGDERVEVGMYARMPETRAVNYIEGVTHHFLRGTQPGQGRYETTLEVTRGRGHIVRAGLAGPGNI